MSTQDIYNYRKVNEHIITSGQPTIEQLKDAAVEGFQVVINLATSQSENWLAEEAELVRSLGMTYHHIPVEWQNPRLGDFATFEQTMLQTGSTKMLIHCAANFRVTAFYGLFAMKHLGWTEEQAEQFRASVWAGSNYPIWEEFLQQVKKEMLQK